MNKDIFEGKWRQVKGALRTKWGELTDDDLDVVAGNSEQIYGILQQRYGLMREDAEKQIKEIVRRA
ncbi:Hypothetical protein A7982_00762 [Minicystis rosea]|nr:Hypothetical protein A7982_00762 [Minicystis rosea]